ncbi:MAG: two-component system response regulator [Candidatus Hydrogenedentota bacterium]|nr:MAG: two-component system response regulator [Candidatus Hydrogenedentota bacterium]
MPTATIDVKQILRNSPLFAGLDEATLIHIAQKFQVVSFRQGDTIFSEGDVGDTFYVVHEGHVALSKKIGLWEREMRRLSAGDYFGEMALITQAKRSATVRTLSPTVCACMDEDGFNDLMETDARFAQRMLKLLTERLRQMDENTSREMVSAYQALSFSLAKLADSRDPETGGHLYRVRAYCELLAQLLADHPKYRDVITDNFIENIYLVSPLHDIGKVAIPDGVLMKQGKLTDAEFQIMATHATLGAQALDTVLEYCDNEIFQMAKRIILCHHECFDGSGYPRGLQGEEIPVEARIMALADNYDALLSERVYKRAFEYDETKAEIKKYSGTRFDPNMAEVMVAHIDRFEAVHRQFAEEAPEL